MTDRAGGEIVEIVDADGVVLATGTRSEMRATNAMHRAVYVVVFGRDGAVLVHQRAPNKDLWPSRWDVAFGGICAVGEAWALAARREVAEEAGIELLEADMQDCGPILFESPETRVVGRVFAAVHDGPFTFPDGEVVAHAWVRPEQLADWAAERSVCEDSLAVVVPTIIDAHDGGSNTTG
jgi:isopentenyldiphosphate isomerase